MQHQVFQPWIVPDQQHGQGLARAAREHAEQRGDAGLVDPGVPDDAFLLEIQTFADLGRRLARAFRR